MADLSPEQVNKLISALESIPPGLTELKEQLSKSVKKELSYNDRLKKSADDVNAKFENLKKQLDENLITQEQYKKATKDLANSSKELAVVSDEVKSKVKEFGTELGDSNESLKKFGKGMGDFATAAIRHTADFAKSVQTSTKGYQLAGAMLNQGADLASNALTGAGGMATAGGQALSVMGGKARIAGIALQGLGALSTFAGGSIKALRPAFDLLVSQLQVVTDGYDKSVAAGAIFADSYGGFAKSAAGAGLSIQQFGDFLSKNNDVLSQAGIGIAQAAQRVGAVGKVLKDSGTDTKLQKLGYGFEEQAEITARVMADMNRAGRDIRQVSEGDIAASTEKYATNLRLISAITGEDAKKRQDAARAQMNNLAAVAKVEEMRRRGDVAGADRMQAILSTAPKGMEKITAEIVANGRVVSVESAKQLALMGQAGTDYVANVNGLAGDTSKSGEDVTKSMNDVRTQLKDSLLSNIDQLRLLGTAAQMGNTSIGSFGEVIGNVLADVRRNTEGLGDRAAEDLKKAKEAQDGLTTGIVASNIALQELKLKLDAATQTALPTFATEIGNASKALVDFVTKVGDQSLTAKITEGIGATVLAGLTSVFGPTLGEKLLNKITGAGAGATGAGTPTLAEGATGGTRNAAGQLIDKNGNPLKGAALKSAEEKAAREAARQAEEAAAKRAVQTTGAKVLSRAGGAVVGAAFEGYQSYGEWQEAEEKRKKGEISESEADKKKTQAVAGGVGGTGGALAGAAIGAGYGALLGPIGAVVGGLIGGAVGAYGGRAAGEKVGSAAYDVVKGEPTPVQAAQVVNADAARNPAGTPAVMPTPDPAAIAAEAAKAQAAASTTTNTPVADQRKDPMEILISRVAAMQEQVVVSNMYLKDIRTYTEKTAQRVG